MDMILNSLPSRTWNRLGINESFVTIEDQLTDHTPEAVWDGKNAHFALKSDSSGWADLVSGMGRDLGQLAAGSVTSVLHTDAGVRMESPLTLKYFYKSGEKAVSRLRLHAEKDSELSIILWLQSQDREDGGISTIQTEIQADAGSRVRIYVAQLLGKDFVCLNDIGGVCDESASIELVKLELGAGKVYAGTHIDLKGDESSFTADVGYHVRTGHLQDMNYVATHHGARTNSLMKVAGTLEEDSHKVFRGTIDFPRGCPGAKGTESEDVLLMGENMINQTIPLILCKEEDVEGNHGASIGRLDEKVLFYLSTRGISAELAQQIIAQARIEAICSKIPSEEIQTAVHEFEL